MSYRIRVRDVTRGSAWAQSHVGAARGLDRLRRGGGGKSRATGGSKVCGSDGSPLRGSDVPMFHHPFKLSPRKCAQLLGLSSSESPPVHNDPGFMINTSSVGVCESDSIDTEFHDKTANYLKISSYDTEFHCSGCVVLNTFFIWCSLYRRCWRAGKELVRDSGAEENEPLRGKRFPVFYIFSEMSLWRAANVL